MTQFKYVAASALIAGVLSACGGGGSDAGGDDLVNGAPAGSGNGTFTLVTAMSTPREEPCSALLPDGRALIAGGYVSNNAITATTEIFDPATRQWSTAAPMNAPRIGSCLMRLNTGKILAVGGRPEIYDPATNTWAATAAPSGSTTAGTVTTLADARVLVIPNQSTTAQIYNPADGTWTAVLGFDGRSYHSAALLKNGQVLVSGGRGAPSTTALLFDPAARSWTRTGNLNVGRSDHLSATLADGRVIVSHGVASLSSAQIPSETYDPSTGAWTLAGVLIKDTPKTTGASGTLLQDGRFLVAGGQGVMSTPELDQIPQGSLNVTNAEAFQPSDSSWHRVSPAGTGLKQPRFNHAAVLLNNGSVLLAGGMEADPLASAEIFTP